MIGAALRLCRSGVRAHPAVTAFCITDRAGNVFLLARRFKIGAVSCGERTLRAAFAGRWACDGGKSVYAGVTAG